MAATAVAAVVAASYPTTTAAILLRTYFICKNIEQKSKFCPNLAARKNILLYLLKMNNQISNNHRFFSHSK